MRRTRLTNEGERQRVSWHDKFLRCYVQDGAVKSVTGPDPDLPLDP